MRKPRYLPAFLLLVSFFGLVLANWIAASPPDADPEYGNGVVGTGLIVLALLGILATFYPAPCSQLLRIRGSTDRTPQVLPKGHRGHHPPCEAFSSHVFTIRGHTRCVACTGLLLGGVAVTLLSVALVVLGTGPWSYPATVLLGTILVGLGLLQSWIWNTAPRPLRFALNAVLPVGAFLVLAGLSGIVANAGVDLFFLIVTVFWLAARTYSASWNHHGVCGECVLPSCPQVSVSS